MTSESERVGGVTSRQASAPGVRRGGLRPYETIYCDELPGAAILCTVCKEEECAMRRGATSNSNEFVCIDVAGTRRARTLA